MNTEKDTLLDCLLEGILSRNQSHTNEFILANYIVNVVFRKPAIWEQKDTIDYAAVILRKDEDYASLTERYQSLMEDFQGKCDEHIALEATYQERCAEYDTLQEKHDELGSHYDALTATTEQHKNSKAALQREHDKLSVTYGMLLLKHNDVNSSKAALLTEYNKLIGAHGSSINEKAALQRDYDQLGEALSLKNSECIDLLAQLSYEDGEHKTLQAAAESYLKVIYAALKAMGLPEATNIYTLEDEVKELKDANIALFEKLNFVTKSKIHGVDDAKAQELIMTLRDIGRYLGADYENASTILAWVKQNIPAGVGSSKRTDAGENP